MTRKRTNKEVEKLVNKLGFELLDGDYKDAKKGNRKVIIKDSNNYKYCVSLDSILNAKQGVSPFERRNPFTLENISVWLNTNKKNFCLSKENEFKGSNNLLNFICLNKNCKEEFSVRWNNIWRGQCCPFCSGKRITKFNNFAYCYPNLVLEYSDKNIRLPEEIFPNSHEKMLWICSKCNHKWLASPNSRVHSRTGCPACAGKVVTDKNRLSILYPEIAKEWHPTKNGDLTPYDVSFGSGKKYWWICCVCKNEWKAGIAFRTKAGNGCPKCSESKGEKQVRKYLTSNKIFYIPQYRDDKCKDKRPLPFDFYLPDYNILIEYDGIIHYKDKFNIPIDFKLIKKHDKIKTKYCKDNNIKLIRIPYWEFDNVEKILKENLF